ncbi:hypothetical protein ILUMI_03685, partial [Ignelater luminosus]
TRQMSNNFCKMVRETRKIDARNCLTITAWNDNRAVLTVSSCRSVEPIKQVSRWISSRKKKLHGGGDRMDENIDKYR